MSAPYLIRLRLDGPKLLYFAQDRAELSETDEGFGYILHSWLTAMFGEDAPKPFRFFPSKNELLGYTRVDADTLLNRAKAFADPQAFSVLVPGSLASKEMPGNWSVGQRLKIEVVACPISRKEGTEKDIYLRELDRLGEAAGSRAEVYTRWIANQFNPAIKAEQIALTGFSIRKLLRRPIVDGSRVSQRIERPVATFSVLGQIADADAFEKLLIRGAGRHRAFGFGMLLLKPA